MVDLDGALAYLVDVDDHIEHKAEQVDDHALGLLPVLVDVLLLVAQQELPQLLLLLREGSGAGRPEVQDHDEVQERVLVVDFDERLA